MIKIIFSSSEEWFFPCRCGTGRLNTEETGPTALQWLHGLVCSWPRLLITCPLEVIPLSFIFTRQVCVPALFTKHSCSPSFWAAHLLEFRRKHAIICRKKRCLLIGPPCFHPPRMQATLTRQAQLPPAAKRLPRGSSCRRATKRSTDKTPSGCTRRGFTTLQTPGAALRVLQRHLLVLYLGTTYMCTNILYLGIWQGVFLTVLRSCGLQESTQPCMRQEKRELSPPPGKRQLLEPSTGKASARFSLGKSREFNQNIQSHMKLDFIHSSTCVTACFNFFTHLRKSLETLQAYSVNQDLLDHITESLESARLFSTKAL